jgi:hypothetical protein
MKFNLFAVLLALSISFSVNAQFGGLGGLVGGAKGGGGDAGAQIDSFNADAQLISTAVGFALLQIQAALGSKESGAAALKVAEEHAKATTPGEKDAIMGRQIKESGAATVELLKAGDAKAKMESLSEDMKKKVAQSILAVAVAGLKAPAMINKGKNVIQSVGSNPMMITKLGSVKDGITLLADALPKLAPIVTTGMQLMRDVKVDPGTPTESSKLEANPNITMPDDK